MVLRCPADKQRENASEVPRPTRQEECTYSGILPGKKKKIRKRTSAAGAVPRVSWRRCQWVFIGSRGVRRNFRETKTPFFTPQIIACHARRTYSFSLLRRRTLSRLPRLQNSSVRPAPGRQRADVSAPPQGVRSSRPIRLNASATAAAPEESCPANCAATRPRISRRAVIEISSPPRQVPLRLDASRGDRANFAFVTASACLIFSSVLASRQ